MDCPASVTIEGKVYFCNNPHDEGTNPGYHFHKPEGESPYATPLASWYQRVVSPEREWQPGDVVRDAVGKVAELSRYFEDRWWVVGHVREVQPDSFMKRPLTLLVPAPEPVDLVALADVIWHSAPASAAAAAAVCKHLGLEVKES